MTNNLSEMFLDPVILASGHGVGWPITLLFSLLLVGLIACLALEEKIHAKKSIIAGSFAVVCLLAGTLCGILSFEEIVVGSHEIKSPTGAIELDFSEPVEIANQDKASVETTKHLEIADGGGEVSDETNHEHEDGDASHTAGGEHVHSSLHVDGHRLRTPVYIPGIDWSVIAIILGSSLFVDITSKSGLFSWIAIKVTKASRGDPLLLLVFYGIMTVVFSAVLNNAVSYTHLTLPTILLV